MRYLVTSKTHESNDLLRICEEVFPEIPHRAWRVETEEDWYWECEASVNPHKFPESNLRFSLWGKYEEDEDDSEDSYTDITVSGASLDLCNSFEYAVNLSGPFDAENVHKTLRRLRRAIPKKLLGAGDGE